VVWYALSHVLPWHASPRHGFHCRGGSTPPRTARLRVRVVLDSESPRQLDRDPGSDPELERHSMSLSKHSQCFTQFVCCNCYERGADKIHCTFSSNKRAAALQIARSATCRDAGKGVKTVKQENRPSKRFEDHETDPIGGAGTWPVRPAAPGMTYRTQNRPNL
jgi:hypothetical protein